MPVGVPPILGPDLDRGYPIPGLNGWGGIPFPGLDGGYPLSRPGKGVPPSRPGKGVPPPGRLGYLLSGRMGVPPCQAGGVPPRRCEQTENITFLILRMREGGGEE